MIAIGYHFVFIICLSELTLSVNDDQFNEESNFLNYIFNLHNEVRTKHRVQLLIRDEELDDIASRILDNTFNDIHEFFEDYGMNSQTMMYNDDTILNEEEANDLFAEWYNKENNYNYCFEPSNDNEDEFTQIVWKDTEKIGIALKWETGYYIVQVVYYPSGNIQGQFKMNVLQPPIIAQAGDSIDRFLIYKRDAKNFVNYIYHLHNVTRTNHGLPILRKDVRMEEIAAFILNNMSLGINRHPSWFGMNYQNKIYDNNTRLDAAEAEAVFSIWYNNVAAEFTQIVREETKTIGIAMRWELGYYRILAFYHPYMGNMQ